MDVYLTGDVITMRTTVVDSNGTAADPTSLTLTYTDQAGNATTKTWPTPADITRDSTGVYHFDATGLAAGHWRYTWTAAGLYAGTDTDVFEVYDPADVPRIVSVADAKTFLRLSGTADDALLNRMVTWATARIIREIGAVVNTVYTETVCAVGGGFVLTRTPVLSVSAITPLNSYVPTVDVATLYVTNSLAGVVTATGYTTMYGHYNVTYRAGYNTVPPGVDGAVLELLRHWWTQSQAHGSATYSEDNQLTPLTDFPSLPYSVLNKLAAIPRVSGVA